MLTVSLEQNRKQNTPSTCKYGMRPNQEIHFDYLNAGKETLGTQYIKDDFSGYCWLEDVKEVTSANTANNVAKWNRIFTSAEI